MFKVIAKRDMQHGICANDEVMVYSVKDDANGYPKFLTFINKQWVWLSAKHFTANAQA